MILHIVAILMILGLAYVQMTQGIFSSIVMAVCTILSAAIALGFYQWFAVTTQIYEMQPTIAEAISMGLLFVGPLYGLRYLADKYISGDIYFDLLIDRIGGALFGLVSGTVMVGMLLIVIQLSPFDRVIWGDFRPFSDTLERDKKIAPFFPDDFVVGLGKLISAGSMSGGETLGSHHDNLLLEAFGARNTAGRKGRTDTPKGAIKTIQAYDADDWANIMDDSDTPIPSNPVLDEHAPTKVVVVRVSVNIAAAGGEKKPYWWRLPTTHFRLRCREREGQKVIYTSYYPLGYVYYDLDENTVKASLPLTNTEGKVEPAKLILERPGDAGVYGEDKFGKGKISEDKINLYVDWIFVLPRTAIPQELFFRRSDGVKVPASMPTFKPGELRERMLTTEPPDANKRRR